MDALDDYLREGLRRQDERMRRNSGSACRHPIVRKVDDRLECQLCSAPMPAVA